jgi:hypothetical protein
VPITTISIDACPQFAFSAVEFIPANVGTVLTAFFVGGGSNLLHQITQPSQKVSMYELPLEEKRE